MQAAHTPDEGKQWSVLVGRTWIWILSLIYFFLTFIQLAVVQPTAVNISANGFGYAICQVCNNVYFLFC